MRKKHKTSWNSQGFNPMLPLYNVDCCHMDGFSILKRTKIAGAVKRSIEGCKNLNCMATSPKSSVFAQWLILKLYIYIYIVDAHAKKHKPSWNSQGFNPMLPLYNVDCCHMDGFSILKRTKIAGAVKRSIEGCKNLNCMATSPKSSVFA